MTYAAITGWGSAMPPSVLSNGDLSTFLDTNDEWIASRTGLDLRPLDAAKPELPVVAARAAGGCTAVANPGRIRIARNFSQLQAGHQSVAIIKRLVISNRL